MLHRIHERIASLDAKPHVTYRDLRPLFLDDEGRPNECMSRDHIHITAEGYLAWMEAIEPLVAALLAD